MMKPLVSLREFIPQLEEEIAASRVTAGILCEAIRRVGGRYLELRRYIPRDHAWRDGKLKDAAAAMQDVALLAQRIPMSDTLVELLSFLVFTADIGRLELVVDKRPFGLGDLGQRHHGLVSAKACEHLGVFKRFGMFSVPVFNALRDHSQPSVSEDVHALDNTSRILTSLLRDLDKMSIIIGKARAYVDDEHERARQCVANRLTMDVKVSEEVMLAFTSGGPIDRLRCTTYIEWLLQFLAWRADFVFQETWDLASAGDHYNSVIRYIRSCLEERGDDYGRLTLALIDRALHDTYELI